MMKSALIKKGNFSVISVAALIRGSGKFGEALGEYVEVCKKIENAFTDSSGVRAAMMCERPFFITGHSMAEMESFDPERSEFYSLFGLLHQLAIETESWCEDEKWFSLVKKEHVPKSPFEMRGDHSSPERCFVYPLILIVDNAYLDDDRYSLTFSESLQAAIKACMADVTGCYREDVMPMEVAVESALSLELVMKAVQHCWVSESEGGKTIRFEGNSGIGVNGDKGRESASFNICHARNDEVFLPLHSHEDFTACILLMQEKVSGSRLTLLGDEEKLDVLTRLWTFQYRQVLEAFRVLSIFGYTPMMVRATPSMVFNGDFSAINEAPAFKYDATSRRFNCVDKNEKLSYNLMKTSGKVGGPESRPVTVRVAACKETSKARSGATVSALLSIHAEWLDGEGRAVEFESFYGNLTRDVEKVIMDDLQHRSEGEGAEVSRVESVGRQIIESECVALVPLAPQE